MRIGCLKEIKDNENRVGLTPGCAEELVKKGHEVFVENYAGNGSGFSDKMYENAGAKLKASPKEICQLSDLIVKVKEPLKVEYCLLEELKGKMLFTYLHLAAAEKSLTEKLLEQNITAIAYETVECNGKLPLLEPMSEVAGGLATQFAAQYLQIKYGGKGKSMTSIHGVEPVNVVIVGGGVVGATAAEKCAGMGANVVIFEKNKEVINELAKYMPKNVRILSSSIDGLRSSVAKSDVVVGAVLVHGAKAPKIVTEDMVKSMEAGSVIVDVAIDQGGCVWGSRPTTHSDPIYIIDGKVFCCITNMPGQVAHDSTKALTNATLPFILNIAEKGLVEMIIEDSGFAKGINTINGKLTCKPVADALGLEYTDLNAVLAALIL